MTDSVNKLITTLYKKREALTAINKKVKVLEEERDEIAERLIAALDAQGIEQSRVKGLATATISESIVPQVEDWDKYWAFIGKHKAFYLLERRPAVVAYRELLETRKGRKIPGVTSFKRRTIRLLSAKKT